MSDVREPQALERPPGSLVPSAVSEAQRKAQEAAEAGAQRRPPAGSATGAPARSAAPTKAGGQPQQEASTPTGVAPQRAGLAERAKETLKQGGMALGIGDVENIRNDAHFIKDLETLRRLRSFIRTEAVPVSAADAPSLLFPDLEALRGPTSVVEGGTRPSEKEYTELNEHLGKLFGLLTPDQRSKFSRGEVPRNLVIIPILFAITALLSLMLSIRAYTPDAASGVLPYYLIWLISLGSMGSLAFIGMNALSLQFDISFDLSNMRLNYLRIILGALFGLVLTVPFGFGYFLTFLASIRSGKVAELKDLTVPALMLLLPFILGFSTPLVILILNRLVDAVQGFFGVSSQARQGRQGQETAPAPVQPRT